MKKKVDVQSFNALAWHDSKLRSFRILRKEDTDEVRLDVELRGTDPNDLTPVTVIFEDAVFFISDIDLQGKRECADDISSAKCHPSSPLLTRLQDERLKFSPGVLAGYFHFSFYLIPPGGSIDIVAASFTMER